MNEAQVRTIEQMREVLSGTQVLEFWSSGPRRTRRGGFWQLLGGPLWGEGRTAVDLPPLLGHVMTEGVSGCVSTLTKVGKPQGARSGTATPSAGAVGHTRGSTPA